MVAKRLIEEGYETVEVKLPVVLTVVKEINEPRTPSLRGKMNAKKAEIADWSAADIEAPRGQARPAGFADAGREDHDPAVPRGRREVHGRSRRSLSTSSSIR